MASVRGGRVVIAVFDADVAEDAGRLIVRKAQGTHIAVGALFALRVLARTGCLPGFLRFVFFIHDVLEFDFQPHLMDAVLKGVRIGLDPELAAQLRQDVLDLDGIGRFRRVVAEHLNDAGPLRAFEELVDFRLGIVIRVRLVDVLDHGILLDPVIFRLIARDIALLVRNHDAVDEFFDGFPVLAVLDVRELVRLHALDELALLDDVQLIAAHDRMEEHVRVVLVRLAGVNLVRRVRIGNHDNLVARLLLGDEGRLLPCFRQFSDFDAQFTAHGLGNVFGQHVRELPRRLRAAEDEEIIVSCDRHGRLLDVFFDAVDVALELQVPILVIAIDGLAAVDDVVRQVRVPGVLDVGEDELPGHVEA